MDIAVNWLNAQFIPYDMKHLLLVWVILTIFLFIATLIISSIELYPTQRQFWNVLLIVLVGTYLLSGVSFLLFRLNAIFTIMALVCIAFVILGDVGVKERDAPLEDWWLSRLTAKKHASEDLE